MAKAAAPFKSELLVLVLCGGLDAGELVSVIEGLKNSSKSIGTHKRRELYWQAYTKLSSKVSSIEGKIHSFIKYSSSEDGEGQVEIVELTKRQRGLVGGGCEILGHKLKPPEDPKCKSWCVAFSEEEAQEAWDDLMSAEPCIYLTNDGVFTATRFKRALCKGLSGLPKTVKEVEELVGSLAPDKPLKSVSFGGNDPPKINGYNVFVAGPSNLGPTLPETIGYVSATSPAEVYGYFLQRRNKHSVAEADKLIAQMLGDVNKGLQPTIAASQKDAAIAYKNSLMKRVFVHESMKKFVDRVRSDGNVEMTVVMGELDPDTDFAKFGGLVFELFYRVDLSTFG